MKYKFVVACLLGTAYYIEPSQQIALQQQQRMYEGTDESIDESKTKQKKKQKIPKGSLLHKLMQEMKEDFTASPNTESHEGETGSHSLAEGNDDVKAKKRQDLKDNLFGKKDEEASTSTLDEPSSVVSSNKNLESPKQKEQAAKETMAKLDNSKVKISKKHHRSIEHEDTTHDAYRGDYKEKNHDKMSEADKTEADSHHQGSTGGNHSKTGTTNAPFNEHKKKLPNAEVKVKPFSSAPRHLDADDFKKSKLYAPSATGISIVYVTLDNEYIADKLVKRLFSEGMIADSARSTNFERSYMAMGTIDTQDNKAYLELTTQDSMVTKVVDYINQHNENSYDYPVPDVIVEPVQQANPTWVSFVKKSTGKKAGFKYDDPEDGESDPAVDTNVDVDKDIQNEVAAAESDTAQVLQAITEAEKSIKGKKTPIVELMQDDSSSQKEADQEANEIAKSVKVNESELVQAEIVGWAGEDEEKEEKKELTYEEKQAEQKKTHKQQLEDYSSLDLDDEVPNSLPVSIKS